MSTYVYAPSEVRVLLAGLYSITGFAEGSSVSVSKVTSPSSSSFGISGQVERVQTPDRRYRIDLSLMSTSPSNDLLNAMFSIDQASGRLLLPIYIQDGSGTSQFTALESWITEVPSMSFTDGVETRTWTIECADGVYGLGGNSKDRDILSQAAQLSTIISQVGGSLNVFEGLF